MEKIAELRERLQGPRRRVDTPYGRAVMRPLSIYLTLFFFKLGLTPKIVTFLSVLVGLTGIWRIWEGDWVFGILLVNGWYLLDHCDGELARLRDKCSASGLFFDTIANAFIAPLLFFALGVSVGVEAGRIEWVWIGFTATFGYQMMLLIPYCEAAVVLQWTGSSAQTKAEEDVPTPAVSAGSLKQFFMVIHRLTLFPSVLPVLTVLLGAKVFLNGPAALRAGQAALLVYAFSITLVWSFILIHMVATDKLNKKYPAKPR